MHSIILPADETYVNTTPFDEVDFEADPACQIIIVYVHVHKLLGVEWRRLADTPDSPPCGNPAEWLGRFRCCARPILACNDCKKFTDKDGFMFCRTCNRNRKCPVWVRI